MLITYHKYHALLNDFLVIDLRRHRLAKRRLPQLALKICHRKAGVGADGVVCLSRARGADVRLDIYNSDGGWAEKSGNGLRIAAVHTYLTSSGRKRRTFRFATGSSVDEASMVKKTGAGYLVKTELGKPDFETRRIPVKSRRRFLINAPLRVGGKNFPVTCLSVGNPHTVLFVDNFDFDWPALGAEIERHRAFPNRTNVEFVKVVNRRKVKLADWERGAGATASSGTGAAAAVVAGVIQGILERRCRVIFDSGPLDIHWSEATGIIELTGPAEFVTGGTFNF